MVIRHLLWKSSCVMIFIDRTGLVYMEGDIDVDMDKLFSIVGGHLSTATCT